MKLSCKYRTLIFLVLVSGLTVHAHQAENSNPPPSQDGGLEYALSSKVKPPETTADSLGSYEEAMELLNSLPKYREITNRPKLSRGLFQPQFDKFFTFLYNSIFGSENDSKQSQARVISTKLQKVTSILEREANTGNPDALLNLAELNFFSYYGHPRNLKLAFDYYSRLASEHGNATAQRMVALMYATGIDNVVDRDQGKALLYTTFATLSQDTVSQMILGFRHLVGIGTPANCEDAAHYYKNVADKAMEHYRSGPPGGRVLPFPKIRLSDEHGGIYGYINSKGGKHHDQSEVEDLLQYHRQLADNGHIVAQHSLGIIYYQGSHSIRQNYKEAFRYFQSAASHMYTNRRVKDVKDPDVAKLVAEACAMLGEMYRRGEATPQDYTAAHMWYSRGAKQNDPIALNGLGVMYLEGIVVEKNVEKAIEKFKLAAEKKNPEAQVNLGLLFLNAPKPEYKSAYYQFASAHKHKYFPAYYYLAEMYYNGQGLERSCQKAVTLYKIVSERGDWLHSPFPEAYRTYKRGDIETSFLWYLIGAEMGYEVGQTNVAWLLDEDRYGLVEKSPSLVPEDLPLIYWTRSANQGHGDSRVKMGDYYFYGIGTDVDLQKAAKCYEVAAEHESSKLGMWNMGWMYENGIGVPKDFHLAKRSYDNSLSQNPDAYLPVTLSLIKLSAKYAWSYLTGDSVGGEFYFGSAPLYDGSPDHSPLNPVQDPLRKEFERIAPDEDISEWGRGDSNDDSEYDGDDRYNQEEDESSFIEDLIILVLCVLVGWMVYIRQFRAPGANPPPLAPQMNPQWI
ncbi:ERAD-associated protein [Basidiobolus ranarum]|uniref:ERAD-associated protein n=1 Tax=Basidiobolus ranarum TaxID=34480 RepID=A0ABR2WNY4_9FUNG